MEVIVAGVTLFVTFTLLFVFTQCDVRVTPTKSKEKGYLVVPPDPIDHRALLADWERRFQEQTMPSPEEMCKNRIEQQQRNWEWYYQQRNVPYDTDRIIAMRRDFPVESLNLFSHNLGVFPRPLEGSERGRHSV